MASFCCTETYWAFHSCIVSYCICCNSDCATNASKADKCQRSFSYLWEMVNASTESVMVLRTGNSLLCPVWSICVVTPVEFIIQVHTQVSRELNLQRFSEDSMHQCNLRVKTQGDQTVSFAAWVPQKGMLDLKSRISSAPWPQLKLLAMNLHLQKTLTITYV